MCSSVGHIFAEFTPLITINRKGLSLTLHLFTGASHSSKLSVCQSVYPILYMHRKSAAEQNNLYFTSKKKQVEN